MFSEEKIRNKCIVFYCSNSVLYFYNGFNNRHNSKDFPWRLYNIKSLLDK